MSHIKSRFLVLFTESTSKISGANPGWMMNVNPSCFSVFVPDWRLGTECWTSTSWAQGTALIIEWNTVNLFSGSSSAPLAVGSFLPASGQSPNPSPHKDDIWWPPRAHRCISIKLWFGAHQSRFLFFYKSNSRKLQRQKPPSLTSDPHRLFSISCLKHEASTQSRVFWPQ